MPILVAMLARPCRFPQPAFESGPRRERRRLGREGFPTVGAEGTYTHRHGQAARRIRERLAARRKVAARFAWEPVTARAFSPSRDARPTERTGVVRALAFRDRGGRGLGRVLSRPRS